MVLGHRSLLEDTLRCECYKKAIAEVVEPGSTVVDVGTGSGLLSYFAVMAGASKVYAIERGPIIEAARMIAQANGWSDRIEFIRDLSTSVELPEKVDVLISEILGSFAVEEDVIRFIKDARARFLKPGGTLLPTRIDMNVAPVEAPKAHSGILDFWLSKPYGVDYDSVKDMVVNYVYFFALGTKSFLAPPQPAYTIDFNDLQGDSISFDHSHTFEIERTGTVHGLAGTFDAHLSERTVLSTAAGKTHWRVAFFPFSKPLALEAGDRVTITLAAEKPLNRIVWTWAIRTSSGEERSQSNRPFVDLESLDFVPDLREAEGETIGFVLDHCDGTSTIRHIAEQLMVAQPDRFPDLTDAMRVAATIIDRNHLRASNW